MTSIYYTGEGGGAVNLQKRKWPETAVLVSGFSANPLLQNSKYKGRGVAWPGLSPPVSPATLMYHDHCAFG